MFCPFQAKGKTSWLSPLEDSVRKKHKVGSSTSVRREMKSGLKSKGNLHPDRVDVFLV